MIHNHPLLLLSSPEPQIRKHHSCFGACLQFHFSQSVCSRQGFLKKHTQWPDTQDMISLLLISHCPWVSHQQSYKSYNICPTWEQPPVQECNDLPSRSAFLFWIAGENLRRTLCLSQSCNWFKHSFWVPFLLKTLMKLLWLYKHTHTVYTKFEVSLCSTEIRSSGL